MKMQIASLNDMRVVLKHKMKDLQHQMEQQVNIREEQDLERICQFFRDIKHQNEVFRDWLQQNGISVMEPVLERNGIFTMDGLYAMNKMEMMEMMQTMEPMDKKRQIINMLSTMIHGVTK